MKFRALLVAMMAGGMLAGCALQEVGAPIYSRTGSTGVATSGTFATTGDTYTVQPGDTLYSIATRNGCNPTELARANGITDPTLLSPGTVLNLTAARFMSIRAPTGRSTGSGGQEFLTSGAPRSSPSLSPTPCSGSNAIMPTG